MNFDTLQTQLLKAIRGDMSQAQLSRELGHADNQVYRWESGRVALPWDDFVQICHQRQRHLPKALWLFLKCLTQREIA